MWPEDRDEEGLPEDEGFWSELAVDFAVEDYLERTRDLF